jgi:hypothetical protein
MIARSRVVKLAASSDVVVEVRPERRAAGVALLAVVHATAWLGAGVAFVTLLLVHKPMPMSALVAAGLVLPVAIASATFGAWISLLAVARTRVTVSVGQLVVLSRLGAVWTSAAEVYEAICIARLRVLEDSDGKACSVVFDYDGEIAYVATALSIEDGRALENVVRAALR